MTSSSHDVQTELGHLKQALAETENRARRLESIQRVTDAALGPLTLAELLPELLGRLRSALSSDTASILLMSPSRTHLSVAASSGISEDDDDAQRVRVGDGFAGRIATSRQPMIISELRERLDVRKTLRDAVCSAMGAPLLSGRRVIGVIHVGSRTPREFSKDDLFILRLVADRAAWAIERTRTLEALHESSRFSALAAVAPVGIYQTDADGACEFVNARWSQIANMSFEDARGLGWLNAVAPVDRARVAELWHKLMREQRELVSEHRYQTGAGKVTWVQETARPLRDASGIVRGFIGTVTDVTPHKTRELHASLLARVSTAFASTLDYEATLENAIEIALPDLGDFGYLDVCEEGNSVRRIARAFRDPARQTLLSGTHFSKPTDSSIQLCALSSGRAAMHTDVDDDWLRSVASGPEHFALLKSLDFSAVLAVPLGYQDRSLGALTLFRKRGGRYSEEDLKLAEEIAQRAALAIENAQLYRDVTRSEGRAREAYRAAREADRRKDEFLAMLGHELRNPISPIATAVDLMELRAAGKFNRELSIIKRQVDHLVCLIDDLLDVSRITRQKIELKKQPVRISELINKSVELVSPLLERQHQALDVRLAGDAVVHGDAHRLAQVVANLLTNAAKYSPPRARIELSTESTDRHVEIRVRDYGQGIEPALLPRIFELFAQGSQTLDRSQGGLGLGLAIVKSMVELHGGEVSAFSPGVGKGSKFIVRLPVLLEQTTGAPSRVSVSPLENTPPELSRRILVVDDNRDAAMTLSEGLTILGHTVEFAFDGPHALTKARSFVPEVAFLDIGLPVMDGYELAARLREQTSTPPTLVAISGYGLQADIQRSVEAGFTAHLVKPIDLSRVHDLLSQLDQGQNQHP